MKIKLGEMKEIKNNADINGDEDFEIFEWAVSNGDHIEAGEKLVEVMVGKASLDICAPLNGIVTILSEDGEIVDAETEIAEIA